MWHQQRDQPFGVDPGQRTPSGTATTSIELFAGSPKKTGKAAEEPPPAKRERIEVKDAPKQVVEEGRIFFFYRSRPPSICMAEEAKLTAIYLGWEGFAIPLRA